MRESALHANHALTYRFQINESNGMRVKPTRKMLTRQT